MDNMKKKLAIGGIALALVGLLIYAGIKGGEQRQIETAKRIADQAALDSMVRVEKAAFDALPAKTKDSIQKAIALEEKTLRMSSHPEEFLSVKKWSWEAGGFGSVGIASITFENTGSKTAKDVLVRINFMGESGTVLNSAERLVPVVVKAGSTKAAREVNFGFIDDQTKSANIEIVTATFE